MSRAVALFEYGMGLPHCCYHVHDFNKCVFVKHIDIASYFLIILIFYCSNTTAFHISDWKILEGGRLVELNCKMGRCLQKG